MNEIPVKNIDSKYKYIRTVPIRFGIRCTTLSNASIHVHDCTEIWYAMNGEATHIVGDKTYIQTAGTCIAVPSFMPHSINITESNSTPIFTSINISDTALLNRGYNYFSYFDKTIHFNGKRLPIFNKLSPEKSSLANNIMYKMSTEFSALPDANFDSLLSLFVDFLSLFDAEESTFKLSSSLKDRTESILKAASYMHANIQTKITIETLCNIANMSRSRFCENFTRITGFSPMDYLLCIRMSYARKLFLLRGKSLSDVAEAIGASDKAHLCRLFKNHYGITPSEYKKLHQTEQQLKDLEARKRNSNFNFLYDFFAEKETKD